MSSVERGRRAGAKICRAVRAKPRRIPFAKIPRRDLGEMLAEAKSLEGDERYKLLTRIQRMHGGLGALMRLQFGRHLKPFEICGYMWAALLTLPERWVQGSRAPTTEWKHATREKVQEALVDAGSWVAGVRVPTTGRERYQQVYMLEEVLKEHNDGLYFVEDAGGAKGHIYGAIAPAEAQQKQDKKGGTRMRDHESGTKPVVPKGL